MPYNIIIGRDEADKKRFENKGLIFIGKGYVKMGQYTSLSNPILMDIARSHIILVSGKRGSGKCLHGDTLITLADGSQIPIKELERNKENVLSLNNQLKIERTERSEFFSREVNKLLKIKLRSGKEIKLTPEHPLFTIKGWKPVEELKIGSRIATPRKSCFGDIEMSEHEIKLLAYLIAEGHTKKIVLFSNSDEKIVKDFEESLNKFDSNLKLVEEKKDHYRISLLNYKTKVTDLSKLKFNKETRQFEKGSKIELEKRSIRKFIEKYNLFWKLAIEKEMPIEITRLRKSQLALFLNRLFSCDGSIYKTNNYWEISYSSSSAKLIRQVQHLLLKFGILPKLRKKKIKLNNKKFESFELVLNQENAIKFIEQIGFFGKKQEKEFPAKTEILAKTRNPNVDTIPKELWETYRPKNWAAVGRAVGYKHPKAMRERIRYAPSRNTLLKIAEIEQQNSLYLLATSDIFWDEITSIEILDGNFKVYDICVPNNHNFVANDIIVHNSYTLGAIAEQISLLPKQEADNIAPLIFDTMGIFWTMKYKNEKEKDLLSELGEKPKQIPIKIFAPFGYFDQYQNSGIPVDEKFSIQPRELKAEDWVLTFNLDITHPTAVLIERIITRLNQKNKDYEIKDILLEIEKDENSSQETKNAALGLFEAADTWGVFSTQGTEIDKLTTGGITTVLDLSVYNSVGAFNVRALVIGLICRKLFNKRMEARKKEELESIRHGVQSKRKVPLVWLFIDEIHEFIPDIGKTSATDALIQLLREGRQPGLSLVMATQQPGGLHKDAITQSDIVISHRITAQPDIKALNNMMQSYLFESIKKYIDDLPNLKGSAIILDDNSERIYPMRIKPRITWHGGEAPTAVKVEKRL